MRHTLLDCYGMKSFGSCNVLHFFLQKIPEGSIILLHACAHNPTGVDPTVRMFILALVN